MEMPENIAEWYAKLHTFFNEYRTGFPELMVDKAVKLSDATSAYVTLHQYQLLVASLFTILGVLLGYFAYRWWVAMKGWDSDKALIAILEYNVRRQRDITRYWETSYVEVVDECDLLQDKVRDLKDDRKKMQDLINDLREQYKILEDEQADFNSYYDEMEEERDEAISDRDSYESERDEWRDDFFNMEGQKEELEEQLEEAQGKIDTLSAMVDKYSELVDELEK